MASRHLESACGSQAALFDTGNDIGKRCICRLGRIRTGAGTEGLQAIPIRSPCAAGPLPHLPVTRNLGFHNYEGPPNLLRQSDPSIPRRPTGSLPGESENGARWKVSDRIGARPVNLEGAGPDPAMAFSSFFFHPRPRPPKPTADEYSSPLVKPNKLVMMGCADAFFRPR